MPAVEIKVYNYKTGQIVKIEALVIEDPRFTRLCTAFSFSPNQIDRFSGPCEILIGVKAQSLQISKIARFKSGQYPNVSIYTSPLLSKLLFIGAETLDSVSLLTSTYRVSRKKVFPFAANLVNIRYKDLAHLSHTIG